jgi:signal transduction histidine kinase/ABC-type uncharacterized transport system substrate-binding protein
VLASARPLLVVVLAPLWLLASFEQPKRLLILYWGPRDVSTTVLFDQAFRASLAQLPGGGVEVYTEYFESNRFSGPGDARLFARYLREKYTGVPMDAVVALTDPPLNFLLKNREGIFPHIPVVFLASRRPSTRDTQRPLTGIILENRAKETLALALKLHPGTQQVFVISGKTEDGNSPEDGARQELKDYERNVRITYLTDLPLVRLSAKLKEVPDRSIVLYLWQRARNDTGRLLEPLEVLAAVARDSRVPVYGVASAYVGHGIVGGAVSTPETWGTRAAEMAGDILENRRAQDIPIESAPNSPTFDARELERWRIAEDSLPPGSIIRYREFTFWERYGWEITAILALFALQAILIAKLLVERRSRRKATAALASLHDDLQERLSEIRELSGRLISAQEDERRRIAMELHDDLSQQVAALGIRLNVIKRKLATVEGARDGVVVVEEGLMSLEASIRALSHELHPALLDRVGLGAALQGHCKEFQELNGIKVHLYVKPERSVDPEVALCLYRVAQETLRNVAKHSGAMEVWVSVSETESQIRLTIEDAGCGIHAGNYSSRGIGLATMKERVRMIGGTFEFDGRPGGGTLTRVTAPRSRRSEANASVWPPRSLTDSIEPPQ